MWLLVLLGPSEQLLHCVATDTVQRSTSAHMQIKFGKLLLRQSEPLNPHKPALTTHTNWPAVSVVSNLAALTKAPSES